MEAPQTQYALRDGVHIGYQVWGRFGGGRGAAVDVLEFNSGLMISIDETVDEPNWLRYTERVAEFCRLIRFDAGGLGLSDPLPHGTDPSIEGWGRDALAVMDAAGCDRGRRAGLHRRRHGGPVAGRHASRAGHLARPRERHGAGRPGGGLRVRRVRRGDRGRGRTSTCR